MLKNLLSGIIGIGIGLAVLTASAQIVSTYKVSQGGTGNASSTDGELLVGSSTCSSISCKYFRLPKGNLGDVLQVSSSYPFLRWTATSSLGITGGSATPAGSDGQIQFNNSGAFGATSTLFWDKVNRFLGIGTSTPGYPLTVVGTSSLDFIISRLINNEIVVDGIYYNRTTTGIRDAVYDCYISNCHSVYIPGGNATTTVKIVQYQGITIRGDGKNKTVINAANGLNDNVIESFNFSNYTNTGTTTNQSNNLELKDLTINGNKNNQTQGSCLKWYVAQPIISHVMFSNCKDDGMYTEWSSIETNPSTIGFGFIEGKFIDVDADANGNDGIVHRGPHDSQFTQSISSRNGRYGYYITASNNQASGGTVMHQVHAWGNGVSGLKIGDSATSSASALVTNSEFECSVGTSVIVNTDLNKVRDSYLYYCPVGLAVNSDHNLLSNIYFYSTGKAVLLGTTSLAVSENTISGYVLFSNTPSISHSSLVLLDNATSSNSNNFINLWGYSGTSTNAMYILNENSLYSKNNVEFDFSGLLGDFKRKSNNQSVIFGSLLLGAFATSTNSKLEIVGNMSILGSNTSVGFGSSGNHFIKTLTSGSNIDFTYWNGSSDVSWMKFLDGGKIGISTTTPSQTLTVVGNQYLTGAFFDGSNASGTLGKVLQSTGTSTQWVATSSLGISGGSLSGGTNGLLALWSSATTLVTSLFMDNGTVTGIGATSSTERFNVASTTGNTMFSVGINGQLSLATTTAATTTLTTVTLPSAVQKWFSATVLPGLEKLFVTQASSTPISFATDYTDAALTRIVPGTGTTFTIENTGAMTVACTASKLAPSAVLSDFYATYRIRYASVVTTPNQICGMFTTSETQFFRGSNTAPNAGGFKFFARVGTDAWTAGNRFFVGLTASTTPISGTSTLLGVRDTIGFGVHQGSTTMVVISNDATGNVTETTIPGMPAMASNMGYDFYLYARPNDDRIAWRVDNASTSQIIATGVVTTDLPTKTTMMRIYAAMSNATNTPANAAQISIARIMVETRK